jgi:hypothetical protein
MIRFVCRTDAMTETIAATSNTSTRVDGKYKLDRMKAAIVWRNKMTLSNELIDQWKTRLVGGAATATTMPPLSHSLSDASLHHFRWNRSKTGIDIADTFVTSEALKIASSDANRSRLVGISGALRPTFELNANRNNRFFVYTLGSIINSSSGTSSNSRLTHTPHSTALRKQTSGERSTK